MSILRIKCCVCQRTMYRSKRQVHEAQKFGWRSFCSSECLSRFRSTNIQMSCCQCKVTFLRRESLSAEKVFCSRSCSVSFHNARRVSKKVQKRCLLCKKVLSRNDRSFCSQLCSSSSRKKPVSLLQREVRFSIQAFFKTHNRIPLKRELYPLYRNARRVFGSWNKAISAAGYFPNPILFSRRVIAKDGHVCDSIAERLIDDWLFEHRILHERSVPYSGTRMTADFKVGEYFVEFFGLAGQLKQYDALVKEKVIFVNKHKIPFIALYPKDIFPTIRLRKIFKIP